MKTAVLLDVDGGVICQILIVGPLLWLPLHCASGPMGRRVPKAHVLKEGENKAGTKPEELIVLNEDPARDIAIAATRYYDCLSPVIQWVAAKVEMRCRLEWLWPDWRGTARSEQAECTILAIYRPPAYVFEIQDRRIIVHTRLALVDFAAWDGLSGSLLSTTDGKPVGTLHGRSGKDAKAIFLLGR